MKMAQFVGSQGSFYYAYADATRRGSLIFIDKCGQAHVLSESSPDAAYEIDKSIAAKLKVEGKVDVESYTNMLSKIHELGKRNASVNIIRDQLFRLNELVNNTSYFRCGDVTVSHQDGTGLKTDTIYKDQVMMAGSLLSREELCSLYETAFNNIKEIAIKEVEAEANLYEQKVLLQKAENDRLKILAQTDSITTKLKNQIDELSAKVKTLDEKIQEANKKTTDATKDKQKAEDDKKVAVAEKEYAIKTKEEIVELLEKLNCCRSK